MDNRDVNGKLPGEDGYIAPIQEKKEPTEEELAKKLGGQGGGSAERKEGQPVAEAPIPFDFSKLSTADIQRFKEVLEATPDRASGPKKNPKILLRRINGRFVKDFGNAYLALVRDTVNLRDVEAHKIPVWFFDAKESVDLIYTDFMKADQVAVEVIGTRTVPFSYFEGSVWSKEKKRNVEMEVKRDKIFLTLLVEGKEVEVESKVANA